jgi:hypothetical protein
MNSIATPKSAALAGAWCVLGFKTFEVWEKNHPMDVATHSIVLLILAAMFFFVPGWLFVLGPRPQSMRFSTQQYARMDIRQVFNREYWEERRRVFVRMLYWLLAATIFWTIFFYASR